MAAQRRNYPDRAHAVAAAVQLRGKGIAGGDQYLEIKVVVPKAGDERSRELLEEFARRNPQRNPRLETPWG